MNKSLKNIGMYLLILTLTLWFGCRKENFVEPPDPFASQELEANPDVITLGQGANALKLKTNQANVIETKNGLRIKGTLYIENDKYGDMPFSTGDFELTKDSTLAKQEGTKNIYSMITGFSRVELPQEGIFKDLQMVGMPTSTLGFKKGSDFDTGTFGWPVNPDRYYFYYENDDSNPFQANIARSTLKNIKKIAIDPTDPYEFFTCDLNGTKLGDLSDVGMAVSAKGLIPFTPLVPYGDISSFNGNIYLTGTFPVATYPVSFTGEAVLAFNSGDQNGFTKFFSGKSTDFTMGLNGQVTFDNTALDWMNVQVVLGQATLILSENGLGDTELEFAGVREMPPTTVSDFLNQIIGKDWNFLDYLIPVEQKETFYGTIGTKLSDWKMGFKMESSLNLPGDIHLDMGKTQLEVTSSQMYFMGEAVVCGFNRVGVEGYAQKSGDFKLTGYENSSFDASWHALSIGYSLGMSVTVQYISGTFTFIGKFNFDGRACVRILKHNYCAHIGFSGSVSISSNGSFEITFSVGVGPVGFDVHIHFDPNNSKVAGEKNYIQTMTATEIPLKMVPENMRFPAVECSDGLNK